MRTMTCRLLFLATLGAASTSLAGPSIIISEVFYDTPGADSKEEWVEFYNPTGSAVDIGEWTLQDNSGKAYTFPGGTILLGGATLVLARDEAGFNNLYGFDPDLADLNRSLNNGGDFLKLFDLGGSLVDEVGWEGGLPGWDIEAKTGESLKRISTGSGPSAWSGHQTPMPGSPSPIPEPASVVLLGAGVGFLVGLRKRRR